MSANAEDLDVLLAMTEKLGSPESYRGRASQGDLDALVGNAAEDAGIEVPMRQGSPSMQRKASVVDMAAMFGGAAVKPTFDMRRPFKAGRVSTPVPLPLPPSAPFWPLLPPHTPTCPAHGVMAVNYPSWPSASKLW